MFGQVGGFADLESSAAGIVEDGLAVEADEVNARFAGGFGVEAAEVVMQIAEFVGGGVVAGGAVQTADDGTVWLDAALAPAERSVLAATATALLLVEELRATLREGR